MLVKSLGKELTGSVNRSQSQGKDDVDQANEGAGMLRAEQGRHRRYEQQAEVGR